MTAVLIVFIGIPALLMLGDWLSTTLHQPLRDEIAQILYDPEER